MVLVYRSIQYRIGQKTLTFVCLLLGLNKFTTGLRARSWPDIPDELLFENSPIHLTTQSRRQILAGSQHSHASFKALKAEVNAARQLTSLSEPLLQKTALFDDFYLALLPLASTNSRIIWALLSTQAQTFHFRADTKMDEPYYWLISPETALTILSTLQKKHRAYALTLLSNLEWATRTTTEQLVDSADKKHSVLINPTPDEFPLVEV